MNLYSNKQKWKIAFLLLALVLVGISLYVSNDIVTKVRERERERVEQWAGAIKKKVELIQLTNRTFTQLREKERSEMEMWIDAIKEISKPSPMEVLTDYSFPMKIIAKNKTIPVIVFDYDHAISTYNNLEINPEYFRQQRPEASNKEVNRMFEDSLKKLSASWSAEGRIFTIRLDSDNYMTCVYNDSKNIFKLEHERDSLIQSFNQELISNESLVPVILLETANDSIIATNLDTTKQKKSVGTHWLNQFKQFNKPIEIHFANHQDSLLYYDDSPELKQLRFFPYIQFFIIGLFIFIGYLIFSTFRKAEQNQVWAGMAKETAHQLGTPLSSLMAWIQLLENENIDQNMVREMYKDVERLETVTNRFSKIGSDALLEEKDLRETLSKVVNYLQTRISSKIKLELDLPETELLIRHNPSLMEWVIENIVKNAVDAIDKSGQIKVSVRNTPTYIQVDIADSGKGMTAKQFKTIFQPGYTTKKRGWGLGLSLVKRIVNDYHQGKVFVLESELGKGTTFRIQLRHEAP